MIPHRAPARQLGPVPTVPAGSVHPHVEPQRCPSCGSAHVVLVTDCWHVVTASGVVAYSPAEVPPGVEASKPGPGLLVLVCGTCRADVEAWPVRYPEQRAPAGDVARATSGEVR